MTATFKTNCPGITIARTITDDDGVALDISSATDLRLDVTDEEGVVTSFEAEFEDDGTDGRVMYTTDDDDFDETSAGHYQGEFLVKIGTSVFRSDSFHFEVQLAANPTNP